MSLLQDYMNNLEGQQKILTRFLHEWLCNTHNLQAKSRYNIPFFYLNTWICYINPIKKDGVEFNFIRARELSLHDDVLDFKSRVMVAGICLYEVTEIPLVRLGEILQEAIILDETTPYTFKKTK